MKKILFLFIALTAISACKQDEKNPAMQQALAEKYEHGKHYDAVIKFDEGKFNFGEITKGSKATHEFAFTNAGTKPLIISEVIPSCGCTTPDFTKSPVLPGKKGSVSVTFDSSGFPPGTIFKSVRIEGNFEPMNIQFQAKIK
ncbi:MAG: DUF1573 domain-containing protein [Flavobacteriaceae bacterium]|jgi:hypothetical protein|nr:DUF1573 domain-containing protein [Flavobacteriaceae bacterium]